MKPVIATATAVVLAASLAACSKKEAATPPPAPAATETAAPAASGDMANMASAKMAKGAGTVTAVDAAAGTVTLDHGPIPEANWPAMKMTFKASPSVTGAVKPGDKVNFDLKLEGGAAEVTAVQKQ